MIRFPEDISAIVGFLSWQKTLNFAYEEWKGGILKGTDTSINADQRNLTDIGLTESGWKIYHEAKEELIRADNLSDTVTGNSSSEEPANHGLVSQSDESALEWLIINTLSIGFDTKPKGHTLEELSEAVGDAPIDQVQTIVDALINETIVDVSFDEPQRYYLPAAGYNLWRRVKGSDLISMNDKKDEYEPLIVENYQEAVPVLEELAEELRKENGYVSKYGPEANETIDSIKSYAQSLIVHNGKTAWRIAKNVYSQLERLAKFYGVGTRIGDIVDKAKEFFTWF